MKITKHHFAAVRFCPWCSTETLIRDKGDHADGAAFSCTICGTGFAIRPSKRYQLAARYQKSERKQRVSTAKLGETLSPEQLKEIESTFEWQAVELRRLREYRATAATSRTDSQKTHGGERS